jgi:hypothetical protein
MAIARVDLATWTALAFGLWLLLAVALHRLRLPGAAVASALLSWLIARVAISLLLPLRHWISAASAKGGPWWR